jgi:hypothetical protein
MSTAITTEPREKITFSAQNILAYAISHLLFVIVFVLFPVFFSSFSPLIMNIIASRISQGWRNTRLFHDALFWTAIGNEPVLPSIRCN